MTAFQALYGRPPPIIPSYDESSSQVQELDCSLASRNILLQELKFNLQAANNRMEKATDSKRQMSEYQVGELMFLKLHPYQLQSVKSISKAYQKLIKSLQSDSIVHI